MNLLVIYLDYQKRHLYYYCERTSIISNYKKNYYNFYEKI